MSSASPNLRSLRARIAANAKWAFVGDRAAATAAARAAAESRFERQVDPDGTLPPAERAQRAESARKAFYATLAYRSAKARAKRKQRTRKPVRGLP